VPALGLDEFSGRGCGRFRPGSEMTNLFQANYRQVDSFNLRGLPGRRRGRKESEIEHP
jgi:hypothetical protein